MRIDKHMNGKLKMNTRIKLTAFGLISMLLIVIAAPLTAQAGTMTIYNKNCTKTYNFATKQRVTVKIKSKNSYKGCTKKKVTIHKGQSRTIELAETGLAGDYCGKYSHQAIGTSRGKRDVSPYQDSHVTCKRDWARVCQCTKD